MGIYKVLIHHDNEKFLYDIGLLKEVKVQLEREGIQGTQEYFKSMGIIIYDKSPNAGASCRE